MKQIKNSLIFLALLLGSVYASAQSINVTATITDSGSVVWANGRGSVFLYSPNGSPFYLGNPVSTSPQLFTLNGSGALAVTLNNTATITPVSAVYRWSLCPNASSSCQTFDTQVTTTNLSTLLSSFVRAFTFNVTPGSFGYSDAEASASLPGAIYYNVTTPALRLWSGTSWSSVGGGSGGTCPVGSANAIQKTNATNCVASSLVDNGTIVSTTEQVDAAQFVWTASALGFPASSGTVDFTSGAARFFGIGTGVGVIGGLQLFGGEQNGGSFTQYLNCSSSAAAVGICSFPAGTTLEVASLPVPGVDTGTPTASQTVCIKAAGPPISLGTCSSVVGAGGACTCN